MNRVDIQKLLDHPDSAGAVKLPAGEFEGPFTINRPCIAVGDANVGTTLWKRDGTVVEIHSAGVTLKNIQIEMTGSGDGEAIRTRFPDTVFDNISVSGAVRGVDGENGVWDIPKVINIGKVRSGKAFTAVVKVFVPVSTEIFLDISGITAEPKILSPGLNTIKLSAAPLDDASVIYGCLEYRSMFRRRTYINMSASEDGAFIEDGKLLYSASEHKQVNTDLPPLRPKGQTIIREEILPANNPVTGDLSSVEAPRVSPLIYGYNASSEVIGVIRGQRITVDDIFGRETITAELIYDSSDKSLDIDGYAFLLNLNGIAENEKSLVFFGNTSGGNGSLIYNNGTVHRTFDISLANVPQDIEKIAIAYSVYGENPSDNFSRVRGAKFILKGNGKVLEFPMDGFFLEKTIVAVEFYRRRDTWKMSAVGKGYSNGLKKLCRSYGLNVSG